MAQPSNSIPVPQPVSGPGVTVNKPVPGADIPIRPDYQIQTIVNSALPNPKVLERVGSSRQHVLRTAKPGDPLPYAFGRTFVRPLVIGADDTGEYLVLDLMWSVGEIEHLNGISQIGWNYALYFPDIGYKNVSDTSLYEHFTGTQGQAASTIMTALKGSYPAYPGIAHSVISMQPGWNLNIVGAGDWIKVIDPRTSPYTTVWTRNPALILADMLTRCGYTMDYSSVADAADYCDELVGVTSPQIERWKISGVIYDRADLQSWIHTMAQYAHCFVDKSGSTFYLRPDKPRASSHTVTADDMVEGSVRLKLRGKRNTVDGVRVTYGFSLRTLDAEYGTLTDPGTTTHLQMPFWAGSFPYQGAHAKRHAEEVYRKSQLEIEELEFVSFDEGLNRTVGDVGTITNAAVGLSAKTMTLIENQQAEPGRWRRRYTEYSASVYQDASYDLDYNDTELYNPYHPPDGPTPTIDWQYNAASPQQPILTLSWIGVSWAYLKDYKVVIMSDDSPRIVIYDSSQDGYDYVPNSGGGAVHTLDLSAYPVVVGSTYTAYIYIRSIVDALSDTPGEASVLINTYQIGAKWFTASSPGNYYRDTAQYRGLIQADGASPPARASDVWKKMTLVFCVHRNESTDSFLMASASRNFAISCDTDGSFYLFGRGASSGAFQGVKITSTGSPLDGSIWPLNQWASIMVVIDNDETTSPNQINVKVWAGVVGGASGEEVYNGTWNHVPGGGSGEPTFNPMGYAGSMWVGTGDASAGHAGLDCYFSFLFCQEQALAPETYWSQFFDQSNKPINIDAGIAILGVVANICAENGDLSNHIGSYANWTQIGTVADAPSSPTD